MEAAVIHVLAATTPTQTVCRVSVRNRARPVTSVRIPLASVRVGQTMLDRTVTDVPPVITATQTVSVSVIKTSPSHYILSIHRSSSISCYRLSLQNAHQI